MESGRRFFAIFFHPNGSLFGVEMVSAPEEPPGGDSAWGSDDQGHKLYFYNRLVVSQDLGATWKEFSPHLPGYDNEYELFQDPDHPDQVCFSSYNTLHITDPGIWQSDDATYQHWKRTETQWRNGLWVNGKLVPGTDHRWAWFTTLDDFFEEHSKSW